MNETRTMTFTMINQPLTLEQQRLVFIQNMLHMAKEFDRMAAEDSEPYGKITGEVLYIVAKGLTKGLEAELNE